MRRLQAGVDANSRPESSRPLPGAELQRLQSLANLGRLSASTVHELKNAMVGVRTFVHLLIERHPDDDLATLANRELERIETIVSHTLRYAAAGMSAPASVNVNQALQFALRLVHPKLHGKAILVQTYLDAHLHEVHAVEGKLHQIFVNLFLNAIEAMSQQGTLTVQTENSPASSTAPASVRILVKDDGKGLPASDGDRIFEPFFTTKPDGTGLGLAITWDIVEEFGGSIRTLGHGGRGATFEILLPTRSPARA